MTGDPRHEIERCGKCGGLAFVLVVDSHGRPYMGCSHCTHGAPVQARLQATLAGPSLAQLVSAHNAIVQFQIAPGLARSLTGEHIATIAYALGVLSAERLDAGDRLEADETKGAGL